MIFSQIFDMVNIGIVVLDRDLKVKHWNRWMALHSGIAAEEIAEKSIFALFPNLNTSRFLRSCKAVLTFGNFSFFSQKLHRYLFAFKPVNSFGATFDYMQQSCTIGPLRDENNVIQYLYITVQDVTEVVSYEQKLLQMNMEDSLTGAYNRRFLEVYLRQELEKYKRYSRKISLIMLDIDFFKKVNDVYGHQCGDFILKCVAGEVALQIRKVDCLARYGGEEFCCLLPETSLDHAMHVAERIRAAIEVKTYDYQGTPIQVTVSLGVSELREKTDDADKLLKLADDALYEAKRLGRNKVISLQS